MVRVQFKVLGPLVVERAGHPVPVPGGRQRALLTALLLRPGQVVSAERLIDDVWAANPPADAANALQQTVSRLRRVLHDDDRGAGGVLVWHPSGYQLAVDPDAVDVSRFERLAELGRRQLAGGDAAAAAQSLRTALRLWRGPALNDVADLPFARAAIVRLDDRRLGVVEDRIEADLLRGRHAVVVPELEGLVAEYPLRERLCALLMNALYAGGRQADALAVYESTRRRLVDELGVDPGPQLRQIYHQILTHDPGLARLQPAGPYRGRRSNLPAPVTSFVGRETEVAQALTLLQTARLVTFTGPGGVGKTRLALQVAARLVDTTIDGVWWVDLAPVGEPTLLADAVLSALDEQPGGQLAPPGTPPARPEDRLRTVLATRDLILVMDNCEHLADAVAHLAATILAGSPGVRIVATSQRSLTIAGETVCPVPPLPVPPAGADLSSEEFLGYAAVRLFTDRAAATTGVRGQDGAAAAVAEICRTLDGVPLAIELAAARTRLMPPGQLLTRLHDRFAVLTAGSAAGPSRQRTLRAVIDWSCRLLTPAERVLLRRLAVFAGGAGLDAVEQVCAGPDLAAHHIVDLVAGLLDKSLVAAADVDGEARYTMLETIRAHAAEQLTDAGEDTALGAAHARYYAGLAAAAVPHLHGPDQLTWTRRLSAERANLRTAIEHAASHADGRTALQLAGSLSRFWWLTGDATEGRRLTTLALHAADPIPSSERAAALTFLAWLDMAETGRADVGHMLEEAAACYRGIGDEDGASLPTALLAVRLQREGQPERSRTLIAQTPTAAGWPGAVAQMMNAWTALMTSDLPQAGHQITHALARFRSLGDRWGQADSLAILAGLAEIHGRYSEALHALDEAAELTKRLGNTDQAIKLLAKAGNILFLTGDYPAAQARHEEALRLAEERGRQSETAFIHNGIGLSARRQGELHQARTHHHQALSIYQHTAGLSGIAYTQACLGYTAELAGDADQAETHHLQSLAIAYQTGDPRAIALAIEGLAGAAALRHDPRRCAILLGAATAMRSSTGAPLPPAERVDVDRAANAARSHLGDKGFDLAFHEGAATTPDAAYNYASWSKSTPEPPAS